MRYVSIALFLIATSLCFLAGYKLGKDSQPSVVVVTERIVEEVPIAILTDTPDQTTVTLEVPEVEPEQDPLELRAEETVQTFFDKNERKLVAEILEVRADSLKVKRQYDGYKLELPVAMLSAEDRAFAAYLWEQQSEQAAPSTSQSEEDIFWDALFE